MCWKTLLNITAISCSQASYDSRRRLPAGLTAVLPSSQGRRGAKLDSRPEQSKNEVLLDTAWHVTCWAEEEWEREGVVQ